MPGRRTNRWSPDWIPGIARAAAEPFVAHGESAERELGDEHRAGGVEALDNGRVVVDDLMFKSTRTPGGGIAFHGEQVFAPQGRPCRAPDIFLPRCRIAASA